MQALPIGVNTGYATEKREIGENGLALSFRPVGLHLGHMDVFKNNTFIGEITVGNDGQARVVKLAGDGFSHDSRVYTQNKLALLAEIFEAAPELKAEKPGT